MAPIKSYIKRQLKAKLEILLTTEPLSETWKKAEDTFVNLLENYSLLTSKEKKRYWDAYYQKVGVKV